MQIEQLKTLKQQLPRGWQKQLMVMSGRSSTQVSEVMNGKKEDIKVLQAAMELGQKHQSVKKTLQKKLQKVTRHGSA